MTRRSNTSVTDCLTKSGKKKCKEVCITSSGRCAKRDDVDEILEDNPHYEYSPSSSTIGTRKSQDRYSKSRSSRRSRASGSRKSRASGSRKSRASGSRKSRRSGSRRSRRSGSRRSYMSSDSDSDECGRSRRSFRNDDALYRNSGDGCKYDLNSSQKAWEKIYAKDGKSDGWGPVNDKLYKISKSEEQCGKQPCGMGYDFDSNEIQWRENCDPDEDCYFDGSSYGCKKIDKKSKHYKLEKDGKSIYSKNVANLEKLYRDRDYAGSKIMVVENGADKGEYVVPKKCYDDGVKIGDNKYCNLSSGLSCGDISDGRCYWEASGNLYLIDNENNFDKLVSVLSNDRYKHLRSGRVVFAKRDKNTNAMSYPPDQSRTAYVNAQLAAFKAKRQVELADKHAKLCKEHIRKNLDLINKLKSLRCSVKSQCFLNDGESDAKLSYIKRARALVNLVGGARLSSQREQELAEAIRSDPNPDSLVQKIDDMIKELTEANDTLETQSCSGPTTGQKSEPTGEPTGEQKSGSNPVGGVPFNPSGSSEEKPTVEQLKSSLKNMKAELDKCLADAAANKAQ